MKNSILCLSAILMVGTSSAGAEEIPVTQVETSSFWDTFSKKYRFLSLSEFMTPAISPNGRNEVPNPEGGRMAMTNINGFHWIDYEVAKNKRVFYWQRNTFNLAGPPGNPGANFIFRDPRFGFRLTQVFDVPGMTTNYDVHFQTGFTSMSREVGRVMDAGIRTNTMYSFPNSKWGVGFIHETNFSFYGADRMGAQPTLSGFLNPFVSYNFTPKFSAMSWVVAPYDDVNAETLVSINSPYIQNGVAYVITPGVWVHAYLNNYLNAPPSVQNTWFSMWLVLYKL